RDSREPAGTAGGRGAHAFFGGIYAHAAGVLSAGGQREHVHHSGADVSRGPLRHLMLKITLQVIALTVIGRSLWAQSAPGMSEHIIWERDFRDLSVSVSGAAAVDRDGRLWTISEYPSSNRLLCITANGEMVVNTELPKEINPGGPTFFSLAVAPSGAVVMVARYSHAVGRAIYFDGAAFANVHPDGTLGAVRKVDGSGPEYKVLVPLSDNHFLLIGDQAPMVVRRLRADGALAWSRMLPRDWVLPSAAPLEHGAACVASPDYRRPVAHMIWIDANGIISHKVQLAANRSAAASSNGFCTVLFDLQTARDSTFK